MKTSTHLTAIADLVRARDWKSLEMHTPSAHKKTWRSSWAALKVLADTDADQNLWPAKFRVIQLWRRRDVLSRPPTSDAARLPASGPVMTADRALIHGFAMSFDDVWSMLYVRLRAQHADDTTRMLALWAGLNGRILDTLSPAPLSVRPAAELMMSVAVALLRAGPPQGCGTSQALARGLYVDLATRGHFQAAEDLLRAFPTADRLAALSGLARPDPGRTHYPNLPVASDRRTPVVLQRFLGRQVALCRTNERVVLRQDGVALFFDVFATSTRPDHNPLRLALLRDKEFVRMVFLGFSSAANGHHQRSDEKLRPDVLELLDDSSLIAGPRQWPSLPTLDCLVQRAVLRAEASKAPPSSGRSL